MKRLIVWMWAMAALLSLTGCSALTGEKRFKDLDVNEIASAAVHLTPPDKTLQIEDTGKLVELLKDVVLYEQDDSYTEYSGQGVTFTLTMTDGSQTNILAYNPFLVVDGVGYQTAYEPCEALNQYANDLLCEENVTVILETPPVLTVVSDRTAVGALLGTYSWQGKNSDGTSVNLEADSLHPLDSKELLVPLETTEKTAGLHFGEEPDSIQSVQCWSDVHWHDPAANSETVVLSGDTLELKPGGYIYEIQAWWNPESGYGGTACYSVYIIQTA